MSGKWGLWGVSDWAHYNLEPCRKYSVIYFYCRKMLQFCFDSGQAGCIMQTLSGGIFPSAHSPCSCFDFLSTVIWSWFLLSYFRICRLCSRSEILQKKKTVTDTLFKSCFIRSREFHKRFLQAKQFIYNSKWDGPIPIAKNESCNFRFFNPFVTSNSIFWFHSLF